ncbi:MAG: GyrI-like domain-containing protein [Anaerolineaceae bacterium]|nr:GyrI-like domain-containing protein [Anaerolineaceae bacterium]
MSEFEVRIVRLAPMRVASAYGFGASPEGEAWRKILAWAESQGLPHDVQPGRFFGFDNPVPSPGSPNYGYEQWMVLEADAEVEASEDVTIKTVEGGLYAVTRCNLPKIGEAWRQLGAWREASGYACGHQQCVEEALSPIGSPFEDIVMDIYLSVAG